MNISNTVIFGVVGVGVLAAGLIYFTTRPNQEIEKPMQELPAKPPVKVPPKVNPRGPILHTQPVGKPIPLNMPVLIARGDYRTVPMKPGPKITVSGTRFSPMMPVLKAYGSR
jgi:hypothetical protein